jgi:hypothetical protein
MGTSSASMIELLMETATLKGKLKMKMWEKA